MIPDIFIKVFLQKTTSPPHTHVRMTPVHSGSTLHRFGKVPTKKFHRFHHRDETAKVPSITSVNFDFRRESSIDFPIERKFPRFKVPSIFEVPTRKFHRFPHRQKTSPIQSSIDFFTSDDKVPSILHRRKTYKFRLKIDKKLPRFKLPSIFEVPMRIFHRLPHRKKISPIQSSVDF